jgi:hypothetical protein
MRYLEAFLLDKRAGIDRTRVRQMSHMTEVKKAVRDLEEGNSRALIR